MVAALTMPRAVMLIISAVVNAAVVAPAVAVAVTPTVAVEVFLSNSKLA